MRAVFKDNNKYYVENPFSGDREQGAGNRSQKTED